MLRAGAVIAQLANLGPEEVADVAAAAMGRLDAHGLRRAGAAFWLALAELSKHNPRAAGELAAAMYAMLAAYRPESPAPLDANFVPTETAPTAPPRSR